VSRQECRDAGISALNKKLTTLDGHNFLGYQLAAVKTRTSRFAMDTSAVVSRLRSEAGRVFPSVTPSKRLMSLSTTTLPSLQLTRFASNRRVSLGPAPLEFCPQTPISTLPKYGEDVRDVGVVTL
jgi:hypothetical protein